MFIKQMLVSMVLATTMLSSFTSATKLPFCQGDYKATAKLCKKDFWDYNIGNACNPKNGSTYYDLSHFPPAIKVSAKSKLIAQLITNVFENGDKIYDYSYCTNEGDGNGYTAGRVGFCSGSNDALTVLQKYVKMCNGKDDQLMGKFLRPLVTLGKLSSCNPKKALTKSLPGYCASWKKAACLDAKFRKAQDDITDSLYWNPALRFAAYANIKSSLGAAIFFDTIIQQGWQYTERDINIWRNIMLTGGPRKSHESEKSYLGRFLHMRRTLLCCENSDDVWPSSADRVDDLQTVLKTGNLDFTKSVTLKNYGYTIHGNENPTKDFLKAHCHKN